MNKLLTHLALLILSVSLSAGLFAQLSGVVTVGSSQNYRCLTCDTGGVFKAINDSGLSGDLTIEIMSDLLLEDGNNNLKYYSGGHSVLIRPGNSGTKKITLRAGANKILIDLDSVANLTIDGNMNGVGRNLIFQSPDSSHAIIQIVKDCDNIQLKNSIFQSDNISTLGYSTGAINLRNFGKTGNDGVTIKNNLIEAYSSTGRIAVGIQVSAINALGQSVDNLKILQNEFNSIENIGIVIESSTGSVGPTQIAGNSFYSTTSVLGPNDATPYSAIYINSGEDHRIEHNYFGGKTSECGGGKMLLNLGDFSDKVFLIRIGAGTTSNGKIFCDSNTVKNIEILGSSKLACQIHVFHVHSSVNADIDFGTQYGNFIGDTKIDASTRGTASIFYQERFNSSANAMRLFYLLGNGKYQIRNSKIGGILVDQINSSGSEFIGIFSNNANQLTVDSNSIGGIRNNLVKKSDGQFQVLYSSNTTFINSNSISGITATSNFANHLLIFNLTLSGGEGQITNNKVGNLVDDVTVNGSIEASNNKFVPRALRVINVTGTSAMSVLVSNNEIGSIKINSNDKLKKFNFNGIFISSPVSGLYKISGNKIGAAGVANIIQESDGKIVGIQVLEPNNNNVLISENKIRGIQGKSYYSNGFNGISITGKPTQSNGVRVYNNTIGDTSVQASSSPSISLISGSTGIAPLSSAIESSYRVDVLRIENNQIGGIKTTSSGQELPFVSILLGDVQDSLSVSGNQIGSLSNGFNMSLNAKDIFSYQMYISIPDQNKEAVIENNLLSNIVYSGDFNSLFQAIFTTKATALESVLVKNNTINNLTIGNGGNQVSCKMISSNNNNTSIVGNHLSNILIQSSLSGVHFEGIKVEETSSQHTISDNLIEKVTSDGKQNECSATGIFFYGPGSKFDVRNNTIRDFDLNSTSDKSFFKGISINSCLEAEVINNVVLYMNDGATMSPTGLYDFANTGSVNIFHNTIGLSGTLPSVGSIFSACYVKNKDATRKISNNVFCNKNSGGTRPHYALYFGTTTGNIGCDFNMLYSENNRTQLVHYTQDIDLDAWQVKSFGLKSISPIKQNVIDYSTGKQLTKLGNDIGLTNLGVTEDSEGNSRPLDSGFDLGAFELLTSGLADGVKPPPTPSGMSTIRKTKIQFFPNPAKEILNIKLNSAESIDYKVLDLVGSVVREGTIINGTHKIDLNGLVNGYYILSISGENSLSTFAVIQ